MKTQTPPLNELSRQAIAALVREVGVVGTIRLLGQYTRGSGDYTVEREILLPDVPMDELIEQAHRIDEGEAASCRNTEVGCRSLTTT